MSGPDARRVAYEVVRRTFEQGAYADRAFAGEAAGLEGRERRQAMRMAYGAVQRMRTVDHAVEQLGGRRPMRLQAPLRNALRVSGYELLFSDAVPARAAVSEGVDLARDVAGAQVAGLANAVLRRIAEAGPEWVETLPLGAALLVPGLGDGGVDGADGGRRRERLRRRAEPAGGAVRAGEHAAGR